jgi:uncharacterized protein
MAPAPSGNLLKRSDRRKTELSRIQARKVKRIAMLISDRTIALMLGVAVATTVVPARAFDAQKEGALPEAMLQALPGERNAGAPAHSARDSWKRFLQTYRSGDKHEAFRMMESEAGRGSILARWKLARMHAHGEGCEIDHHKAYQIFSSLADQAMREPIDQRHAGLYADSLVEVGQYLLTGIPKTPVKQNIQAAHRVFHNAATLFAHPEAQFQLGRMHLGTSLGSPNASMAARWLHLSAEKGHLGAQMALGRLLLAGDGAKRQVARGLTWLEIAKERADSTRDRWMIELYDRTVAEASEEDLATARRNAQRYLQANASR